MPRESLWLPVLLLDQGLRLVRARRVVMRAAEARRDAGTPSARACDRLRGRRACRAPCARGREATRAPRRSARRGARRPRRPLAAGRRARRRGSSASAPLRRRRAGRRSCANRASPSSMARRASAGREARSAVLAASSHRSRLRGYRRCSSPITRSASSYRRLAVVDDDEREHRVGLDVARVGGGLFDQAEPALPASAEPGEPRQQPQRRRQRRDPVAVHPDDQARVLAAGGRAPGRARARRRRAAPYEIRRPRVLRPSLCTWS